MLAKLLLVVVVIVGLGGFFLGWWTGSRGQPFDGPAAGPADSTDGSRAREIGGDIGEATARAADQAKQATADGSITAKIKSKMALDEQVRARSINVDTSSGVVTVSGVVGSAAERQRALQLARETEGVTEVRDRLRIE